MVAQVAPQLPRASSSEAPQRAEVETWYGPPPPPLGAETGEDVAGIATGADVVGVITGADVVVTVGVGAVTGAFVGATTGVGATGVGAGTDPSPGMEVSTQFQNCSGTDCTDEK